MKKYLILILSLIIQQTSYSQKEIDCDGFYKEAIGKYIITSTSIIDTLGNTVYDAKYGSFNLYSKIIVGDILHEYNEEKRLYRFINLNTKKPITGFEIKSFKAFENGYAIIEVDNPNNRTYAEEHLDFFFIDKRGNKLCNLPKNATRLLTSAGHGSFHDGLSKIEFHKDFNDPKMASISGLSASGYIDKTGKIVIPPKYEGVSDFYEGLAAVKSKDKNGILKWGFINTKGETIIDFKFSNRPSSFSEGLAIVENKNGKKGYIDKKGDIVIQPLYDVVTGFYKGYAIVKKVRFSNKVFCELINVKGKTVHTYSNVDNFYQWDPSSLNKDPQKISFIKNYTEEDAVVASIHGKIKRQIINFKGSILFESKPNCEKFSSGLAYASYYNEQTKVKTYGFINKKGVFVIIKSQNQF